MTAVPRRLVAYTVVLGLAFAAAGCAESSLRPAPFEPSEPTAKSSPSSGVTGSTSSPSPTGQAETAAQFILRFVETQNRMQLSGSTSAYLKLTHNCSSCDRIAARVRSIYFAGGYIRTDGWRVTETERPVTLRRNVVSVDFTVDSAATRYRESAGAPLQRFPGADNLRKRVELLKSDHGFSVRYLAELA